MDNLTHFLFGYILFVGRVNAILILLFTNLPDIIAAPSRIYYTIIKDKKRTFGEFNFWIPNKHYLKLYRSTHSLIFCLLLGFILSLFTKKYLVLTACIASHIILDVFSHSGKWATRIFYPFSDFHINSFNWFKKDNFIKSVIIFIIIVLIVLFKILSGF